MTTRARTFSDSQLSNEPSSRLGQNGCEDLAFQSHHPCRRSDMADFFAYDTFKPAPDRSLEVDTQAKEFFEFNRRKCLCDPDWWSHWESWCRQAVDRARRSA